ncbi:DUF1850 domain-containing protein [Salinicoccus carnicancri]|uniref:DUF1850 domain-containing protein n=1 Tax=Salinicoccus carnicancri TaxID=558170 RepID=UPI0002EA9BA4|nr:DUF1850 domain-containing protein [Salinicoccus carnicancri]
MNNKNLQGTGSKKTLFSRNVFLALIGGTVIGIVVALYVCRPTYLILAELESGEILHRTRVEDGERFAVTYIHSVERSPVKEIFEVRGEAVYTMESHTESFGAGMPYEGDDVEIEDGKFIIRNIDRKVHGGSLKVRPSSVFPHHVRVGGEVITISEPPYAEKNLEIRIVRGYFKGGGNIGR